MQRAPFMLACDQGGVYLSVADVESCRAICMREYTHLTFELPQLLWSSAISSETLWCHKFHILP